MPCADFQSLQSAKAKEIHRKYCPVCKLEPAERFVTEDDALEPMAQTDRTFYVYTYRYIDHTVGTEPDAAWDLLRDRNCKALVPYIKRMFRDAGWDGHGRIEVLQIPPVVSPYRKDGFLIFHVRHSENRTSYLATEVELPQGIDTLCAASLLSL